LGSVAEFQDQPADAAGGKGIPGVGAEDNSIHHNAYVSVDVYRHRKIVEEIGSMIIAKTLSHPVVCANRG